jgi:hypothetical protein
MSSILVADHLAAVISQPCIDVSFSTFTSSLAAGKPASIMGHGG